MKQDFNYSTVQYFNDGIIPNNDILPVIFYRKACKASDCASWFESKFQTNGWTNNWRDIILPYDHFHSNTHEVLGVSKGVVKLKIGGKNGQIFEFSAGDAIVIPAGVGHYSINNENEYEIVGGYPNGALWDMCINLDENRDLILNSIKKVSLPLNDPIFGEIGPLIDVWMID